MSVTVAAGVTATVAPMVLGFGRVVMNFSDSLALATSPGLGAVLSAPPHCGTGMRTL